MREPKNLNNLLKTKIRLENTLILVPSKRANQYFKVIIKPI